ncbi:MAG: ATP-binding cassette domain-containing protein [Rickettsiales bacterium]|jgi:ATP-binding cassette subfamily F protein 3|nr:ATP-binding cassette domain-containing protein [Rickettsiales bacterium]
MLKLENISKSFDGKRVFDNISFILNDGEKLGLIGRNGSGKSTVLKIIAGRMFQDEGDIITSRNYRIGYLEQHLDFNARTVLEEACLALPDYREGNDWEAEKILHSMGFLQEDMCKSPGELSGGWQIRLNLVKLLLSEPNLLLLDEPTNYLDIISIRWLKRFLLGWRGSFILVTHDRGFMNDIIDHTLIIHRGVSRKIRGNVDDMYQQIKDEEEIYEKTRLNGSKKREQTQKYIDRFRYKARLAKQVQSKIKMLDKQEKKQKLADIDDLDFEFNFRETITNRPLVEVDGLKFSYDSSRVLIKNLSFRVNIGDKICVIGRNGAGKSTLLRLLAGEIRQNSGKIAVNEKTSIGYFGQMNVNRLNLANTIEEELWAVDRHISRNRILKTAGVMMFSGNDHEKKLEVLSGGERSRVLLGKIILQPSNLLLLDEPTNHLDMESCICLAESLYEFPGASIIVTHDEDFIKNVANRLIVFDNNRIFMFDGIYEDFLREIGYSDEN